MSLNWKEINLILEELDLPGAQIQGAIQSAFDVIGLRVHNRGVTRQLLIALTPGACRIHETFRPLPKSEKPLRFAQFLKSRIVNGWITEAVQLGDNRIIRLLVSRGENQYRLYIRLWSNAANCIVTDENGIVLDAMRRQPKKGEITGGHYMPEGKSRNTEKSSEYEVRELPGGDSFNAKIDAFYTEKGGALSLEALREQAKQNCEGSMGRLQAALDRLRAKEAAFASADRLREYGDIILANITAIKPGDTWLEAEGTGGKIRIQLNPDKSPPEQAKVYYEKYSKAKKGITDLRAEIAAGERELDAVEKRLAMLLTEENPLVLAKLLAKSQSGKPKPAAGSDNKRRAIRRWPGLTFKRGEWIIMVGRDAGENDELLRRHVKGNDLWLHARDFPGSHVFIRQRTGKTVPLDILLDAGNLALFYSKGRNNGEGDLFYTPVKYLRRAKNGPKGLATRRWRVIPTQEKNLHIKFDEKRLKDLESCKE
ncbi:MAG: NFACT family protein [Treponema sp.]|nr:NFACT family protein [Treponema sp.]